MAISLCLKISRYGSSWAAQQGLTVCASILARNPGLNSLCSGSGHMNRSMFVQSNGGWVSDTKAKPGPQDVESANQELDDFFGVQNLDSISGSAARPISAKISNSSSSMQNSFDMEAAAAAAFNLQPPHQHPHHPPTPPHHTPQPQHHHQQHEAPAPIREHVVAWQISQSSPAAGAAAAGNNVAGDESDASSSSGFYGSSEGGIPRAPRSVFPAPHITPPSSHPAPHTSHPPSHFSHPAPAPSHSHHQAPPPPTNQPQPYQPPHGLTHVDAAGRASMVDVSQKSATHRVAHASARVLLGPDAFQLVASNQLKKGDVLTVAQLAGIMGAKHTSTLIPLCHNIQLSKVDVKLSLDARAHAVEVRASASTVGQTGVEMEALTAASVAALTVYDMCKAVAKDAVITDVRLEYKSGGKSGEYARGAPH